jgi:hypothetical protein
MNPRDGVLSTFANPKAGRSKSGEEQISSQKSDHP